MEVSVDFHDWQNSDLHDACQYRERIKFGEKGNKSNPIIAARITYDAGIREGKRLALEKIAKIINN